MEWNQTDLSVLAKGSCRSCGGTGVRKESETGIVPCGCSLRNIFRACYERFRHCAARRERISHVHYERAPGGKSHRGTWSRKEEEYVADFELVARRTLDQVHYRIFRYHFLLRADWRLCARKLGVSRGNFFHAVYRIEQWLGQAFFEVKPYALYPPRDYFALRLTEPVRPCDPPRQRGPITFRSRGRGESVTAREVEPVSV